MANQEESETLIIPLTASCSVEDFDCGEPARNSWLCTRAFRNQASDDTRTYVALQRSVVVGFYAIAVGSIVHGGLPSAIRKNAPDPISCVLLAQLAVSVQHQGKGISRKLVLHAMGQAVRISELAGCRLLAVHPAKLELEIYYQKFSFVRTETTPLVMVMKMQRVRAILAAVAGVTEQIQHP